MDDGMCVSECVTPSTWKDDNEGDPQCSPCEASCATCSGGLPGDCLTCKVGETYLNPGGMCVADCGGAYWEDDNEGNP